MASAPTNPCPVQVHHRPLYAGVSFANVRDALSPRIREMIVEQFEGPTSTALARPVICHLESARHREALDDLEATARARTVIELGNWVIE